MDYDDTEYEVTGYKTTKWGKDNWSITVDDPITAREISDYHKRIGLKGVKINEVRKIKSTGKR